MPSKEGTLHEGGSCEANGAIDILEASGAVVGGINVASGFHEAE